MGRGMIGCLGPLLICTGFVSSAVQATDTHVRYRIQIYRLAEGFRSNIALDHSIWRGDKEKWAKIKHDVTLFNKGTINWGADKLTFTDREWSWNGKPLSFTEEGEVKLPAHRLRKIYSPNVWKPLDKLVRMKIEGKQPFQYLERREDGLFELKRTQLPVGMDLEVKASKKSKDFYLIRHFEVDLRTIGEREAIKDVDLAIGRPILQEWEYEMAFGLKEDRSYGILLQPEGVNGAIAIRLEVDDDR